MNMVGVLKITKFISVMCFVGEILSFCIIKMLILEFVLTKLLRGRYFNIF